MTRTYWLAWLLMPVIGILNGTARVLLYQDALGDAAAHQLSCFTGILLFALYVWLLMRRWPFGSGRQALTVGLTWMGLTVAFEFAFGLLTGRSLDYLLADYNVLAGHLWPLVLLTIGFAPYIFYKLGERGRSHIQQTA